MLPNEVYEHVKYGTGGRPGATATVCGKVFVVEGCTETAIGNPLFGIPDRTRHVIRAYRNGIPCLIRDCPSELSVWRTYWTHEC
jgi:hypothetical protein